MTTAARRRAVADAIDALDNEIATLQDSKRDTFEDYRDKLAAEGMRDGEIKVEIKALKKAIARRRALISKPAEVEEFDEKVDEITIDIMKKSDVGTVRATRPHVARRASREASDPTPHNPETGELLGDAPSPAAAEIGAAAYAEEPPSPSEPQHELIADAEARKAQAARLLEQLGRAEATE